MATYGFHSDAAEEYLVATQYYLDHASPLLPQLSLQKLKPEFRRCLPSLTRWAVIEEPLIRRCLLTRFPYSIYYRWEPASGLLARQNHMISFAR